MNHPARRRRAIVRFIASAVLGLSFFLLPIRSGDRVTVPFDLAVSWVTQNVPTIAAVYCLILIVIGAVGSCSATVLRSPPRWSRPYTTSRPLTLLRVAGVPLALIYLLRIGPDMLLQEGMGSLMWDTLALSVAVIIPIGAALLVLLVHYGFLEFVGTIMQPVMRPLFKLPGRAALDSLTSWVGSYSVGLYLTRRLMQEGYYSRREAYTIATCFSTVSIGFVAVVAQTLDLLHLFPVIFVCYFTAIYLLTAILARLWPVTSISTGYIGVPKPEPAEGPGPNRLLREGWERAVEQAGAARGCFTTLRGGFGDGMILASTILGSILTVGTGALLLARETPLFAWLGRPIAPVLAWLGLPDAALVGPAVLVGITEMYIPALLVQEAAAPARFFVALLSISQLVFFSSVGPMIIDMFRDVPVRGRELVALFLIRTVLLIPVLAVITAVLTRVGLLAT
ncbi:MAG: YjiH family protein [Gemmatimonadota bacterium]|nr:MAG: YjiH family protein [Gemmatimonadota bacterium]